MGSALCHTISFSTAAVILAHLITSYSLNLWDLSSKCALLKYFIFLSFFSYIWLFYLSGINDLAGFTLSEFVTERPHCCLFMTVSYLIPLQWFDRSAHDTFSVLITHFFSQSNDMLPPLYVVYCWNIVRTTCYQDLPLVTCLVNSWRRFFITRGCSSLWWKRKRLHIIRRHIPVKLSITSFNLFQFITVDGCKTNRKKLKQMSNNPILLFLLPSMSQYLGLWLLWYVCGASIGV